MTKRHGFASFMTLLGGISGAAECYDTVTDQWTALAGNKPTRVSNISAASIGDWIYVLGGLTAGSMRVGM